ncbi:calcium-translocating P-type ATPase, SERCA-type [Candidatus Woesearchaeota archaeon]|nr:MAG: calcium-translocating P-type ATPase, SERCA-type [Candidatus Woesearchaeota archaeon]
MPDFHKLSAKEVLSRLGVSEGGLSTQEAQERLKKYGLNRIRKKKKVHPIVIFIDQFKSPMVWILLLAMAVSLIVSEYIDFYVIGAIVVINAVLGFAQEYRAERAIEALKKMTSLKATVLRGGREVRIDSELVVPGDIILLETGDKVPADARIIELMNLQTQEASLTGESTPVKKTSEPVEGDVAVADRKNMVFAGTIVTKGHARAVVVATGMNSEIGKIAGMIQEAKTEPTPLQVRLKKLSVLMGVAVVFIAIVMFIARFWLFDEPLTQTLLMAIALAVAAIPEGLPAVVTVGFSMGVQRLARKRALVRHLPSVETLGACTVICSDKTGTMTHNEMTVRKLYVNESVVQVSGVGYSPEGSFSQRPERFRMLLVIGALNNNSKVRKEGDRWVVIGDPTEAALIVSARKAGLDIERLHKSHLRVGEVEFTSERKRMTTIHEVDGKKVAYTKGAPEVVLKLCNRILVNGRVRRLTSKDRNEILEMNDEFARNALRVLGFAYKEADGKGDVEKNMVWVGLQAMIDPPRAEVKAAVEKCKTAGIKVVMITGDYIETAKAIARDIGLSGRAITGVELESIDNLEEYVDDIAIYARTNPEHKLRIVNALKKKGHIVAMTGDGVNDAPAIKRADLGVAMGITGTDVAKEASEMVLADDNFATIVSAVEEGRRIYDNIRKYFAYLVGCNIGEVFLLVIAMMLGLPLPLIAIQILWINLATDGLPALALGVDPASPNIMRRPPRRPGENIFEGMVHYVFVFPLILAISAIWLFDHYLPFGIDQARTVAFTSVVFFELFAAISCRSLEEPVFKVGVLRNKWLLLAVAVSLGLQVLILSVPFFEGVFRVTSLSLAQWMFAAAAAFVGFVYLELHKLIAR